MKPRSVAFCLLCFLMLTGSAWGQIPRTISFQGVLADANGIASTDTARVLTFKLFASVEETTPLWSEVQTIRLHHGVFNVYLGEVQPLQDIHFTGACFLGLFLESGEELLPRVKFTSVPYALHAVYADSLNPGVVAARHVKEGAVVRSLNGLTDHVTLTAGENVRVEKLENTLILSAAAGAGGDITAVHAGEGLSGGGDAGDVALALADSAVTSAKIRNRAVTSGKIAVDAITSTLIKDGTIATADLGFALPSEHSLSALDGVPDQAVYVDADGKVGIGTTIPKEELHVYSSSGDALMQIERSAAANGWVGVGLRGGNQAWYMYIPENSAALVWGSGSGATMTLTNSGLLGVGTGNPAQRLDVAGTAQMTGFKMPTGAAQDFVLTSDAAGQGTWKAISPFGLPYAGVAASSDILFSITNQGSGGAGFFKVSHATTSFPALRTQHMGAGRALHVLNSGMGPGAYFEITNPGSSAITLEAINDALGKAGSFSIANAGNNSVALECRTEGGGPAFVAHQEGPTSNIALFQSDHATVLTIEKGGNIKTRGRLNFLDIPEIYLSGAAGIPLQIVSPGAGEAGVFIEGKLGIGVPNPGERLQVNGLIQSMSGGFRFPDGTTQTTAAAGGGDITAVTAGSGLSGGGYGGDVSLAVANLGITSAMLADDAVTGAKIADGAVGGTEILNNAITSAKIANGTILPEDLSFTVPNGYSLNAADGTPAQAVYVDNDGRVGIGTAFPIEALHVQGNAYASGNLRGANLMVTGTVSLTAGTPVINTGSSGSDMTIMVNNPGSGKANLQVEGNLGLGGAGSGNILTVQQFSATDPIADAWTIYSSIRWKENVMPLQNALERVSQLRGVSFTWKGDGKQDIGLIAEEVGQVVPEVVAYEENGIDAKSLDYARLVPLLLEAIKEQQAQIDALKKAMSR